MLGIGIIGYGYWGPNLVRNFLELSDVRVVSVCDRDPRRLDLVSRRYPGIRATSDSQELLTDPRVDAVAIATPVSSHFSLGAAALKAGKHVLLEKPLAASSEQAEALLELADERGRTLMVDHTFLYTPAVRKIRELVAAGELGELLYFDSVRVNLGLFQHDVNVLWDLAVHDLAIMDFLLPSAPIAVSATGIAHVRHEPENMAYLSFFFENGLMAHLHVNWLAPVKLRSTLLAGRQKMIVYNDLEPTEKVKVYDKGITLGDDPESIHQLRVNYRTGDMTAPHLETIEALRIELQHFVECIRTGTRPLSDGAAGLRVIRWLEAASRSLALRGEPVELRPAEVWA
jgi:predicted dehydrogenase